MFDSAVSGGSTVVLLYPTVRLGILRCHLMKTQNSFRLRSQGIGQIFKRLENRTGRQNTEPFNTLAQFTQMNQVEFKLLSVVLPFAHAQGTTLTLVWRSKFLNGKMSKFSRS